MIVRPGLILGPWDVDERFRYWLTRVAAGGDVLAPGLPDRPVQFIDVRDLADWLVACAERRLTGVFNATGPADRVTRRRMVPLAVVRGVGADQHYWSGARHVRCGIAGCHGRSRKPGVD